MARHSSLGALPSQAQHVHAADPCRQNTQRAMPGTCQPGTTWNIFNGYKYPSISINTLQIPFQSHLQLSCLSKPQPLKFLTLNFFLNARSISRLKQIQDQTLPTLKFKTSMFQPLTSKLSFLSLHLNSQASFIRLGRLRYTFNFLEKSVIFFVWIYSYYHNAIISLNL